MQSLNRDPKCVPSPDLRSLPLSRGAPWCQGSSVSAVTDDASPASALAVGVLACKLGSLPKLGSLGDGHMLPEHGRHDRLGGAAWVFGSFLFFLPSRHAHAAPWRRRSPRVCCVEDHVDDAWRPQPRSPTPTTLGGVAWRESSSPGGKHPTRVATDSNQLPSSAHDLEAMGMEHRESFAPGWGTVSSEQR